MFSSVAACWLRVVQLFPIRSTVSTNLRARRWNFFGTTKFFCHVIIGTRSWASYETNKAAPSCGFCIFFIDRGRRVRSSESPIPIFRLCRPGLTRSAAGHKNVDSVNERNWRFLFPSWRSSSRVLFYAPPLHGSSDSVVRKNADWILDFTCFSGASPLGPREDAFFGSSVNLPIFRGSVLNY